MGIIVKGVQSMFIMEMINNEFELYDRSSQMVKFTAWKILRGYVHNTKQISSYHFQGEIVDGGVDGDGG